MTQRVLRFSSFVIGVAGILATARPALAMGPVGGMAGMGPMSGAMSSGVTYMGMGQMTPDDPRVPSGGNPSGISVAPGQLGLEGLPSAPTGLPPLPTPLNSSNLINGEDRAQSPRP